MARTGDDRESFPFELPNDASTPPPRDRPASWEEFYEAYRRLVSRFFRCRGVSRDDADDLAQEFFTRALAQRFLDRFDPVRGPFEAYLATALGNFLVSHRRRARSTPLPLSSLGPAAQGGAWGRYEPLDPAPSPDQILDREWALGLFTRALDDLRALYAARGVPHHFEAFLRRSFLGESSGEIAHALGLLESRVDAICSRARRRLRERLSHLFLEGGVGSHDSPDLGEHLYRLLA
ncbi:MAG: sigma-70 family RNA polymerase sigma factor [Planctomycetes bacterium]|nr:sigma-70 family RNA polymerase sigma factor [Planctomycetota bacterium]